MTVLLALVAAWLIAQAPSDTPRPLTAGVPAHGSLAGGERTFYSIDIPAQYAAQVIVRQQGVDLGVLLKRRGSSLPEHGLDFRGGPDGEERQYPAVLDTPATWDIRIRPVLAGAPRGDYTIEVQLTPADDRARVLADAQTAHYDGTEASWRNEHQHARDFFAKSAELAEAAGEASLAAESVYVVARMYDQLGDAPSAIEWQLRALEKFRALGRKDRQARVFSRLGDLSRKVGAVTESEAYFEQGLPLARESGDQDAAVDIINNSGLLLLATGRPEAAITRLESGLPLANALNSTSVQLSMLNNIAQSYIDLGMPDRAVDMILSALPVAARLNSARRTGRTLHGLATAYFKTGEHDKAEETMKKALATFQTTDDAVYRAEALTQYGTMLAADGNREAAMAAFAEARPPLQKFQNRSAEGWLLTSWAQVEIDAGDYESALGRLDTALGLSRAVVDRDNEARAQYLRAVALQKQQRLGEALSAIAGAIDTVESMRGSIARTDLRTSYLAAMRSYYDLYVDLLQQRGDAAAAFEVSERARARTLLEGLAESAAKIEKGADPALLSKERALQRELNAKEAFRADVAQRQGAASAAAKAAAVEIDRLVEQLTAARVQIRQSSPAYAALQQPQPISVAQLQATLLEPDAAMVAYHLGSTHSYAWVITRNAIDVQSLPPMAEIDAVARRYHEALSREIDTLTSAQQEKIAATARAAGRELAALVWRPIEAKVKARHVLIVADRGLQYVPFAALPTSSGAPLIVAHEVVYLPSASVLATLRINSRAVTLDAATAVFADPVFSKNDPRLAEGSNATSGSRGGEEFGRLRFSRREAEAIGERAPRAFQALDFAATKSAVLSRNLRQYRVLHFATHGTLNTEHPELSGLVFSLVDRAGKPIDGFLRLHEIYNLDLDADLVVLSACRTALGREVYGEGLIGLTRGFLYAGASRVVSSVWNVDDRASALLMARFYDAMRARKLTPAAALRAAQLSLLNEARWSNPHYWAAFGLQGVGK